MQPGSLAILSFGNNMDVLKVIAEIWECGKVWWSKKHEQSDDWTGFKQTSRLAKKENEGEQYNY